MKPRLAVLDMIGTTVRAGPEVGDAFRSAFADAGVAITDDEIDAVRGRSKREAIVALTERLLPDVDDRVDTAERIHATFRSILADRYERDAVEVPGAHRAIEALNASGTAVVLTTGLDRDVTNRILRGLGWASLRLGGVLTGDDVTRGRPHPDLILAAMALVGVTDPAHVLVAGDTLSDLEAAAAADVGWIVGVTSGAHSPEQLRGRRHTVLLDSVAELPGWLERTA
jgi:phosphoglycolate phosphatase